MSVVSLPKPRRKATPTPKHLLHLVAGWLWRIWIGTPDLPAHLRLEQRFIVIRYLGILLIAPTLPWLSLSPSRLAAAYGIIAFDAAYNVGVQYLLRRRSPWLTRGYVTTLGDGLLSLAMVAIGGGFTSSFYFILFTTTSAAALRFGYGPALLVVGLYVSMDAVSTAVARNGPPDAFGDFLFRSGLLVITALLAGYLREQARSAEAALAKQLDQASALNESTRALNASLEFETVGRTVACEARRLVAAEDAVVHLGSQFGKLTLFDFTDDPSLRDEQFPARQALLSALVATAANEPTFMPRSVLPSGQPYMVFPLHTRGEASGHLAVVRVEGALPYTESDYQLLASFGERATLAIENASLYKTIGDRSQDLQRAYGDLAAAHQELLGVDEMKTNFIANVSHELRTPLTSIRSFSELLMSYDIDRPTGHEFLTIINTESERLTRLINDVLDITKIEAGQIEWHLESLDLGHLLQMSTRTFASVIEAKGLGFKLALPSTPTRVWADQDRILQVLANLLGNAIKFTVAGMITLTAEVVNDFVHIHVQDTGIGIAAADHKRIFEKFHQVGDTLTDKPKGTGLGLCICRDIVTHQGGHMWVTSALGAGSTFSFNLPLAP